MIKINKMKHIVYLLSGSVILPLIPSICAFFIRVIAWRRFTLDVFVPSELVFSTIMYLIMCIASSQKHRNKKDANELLIRYMGYIGVSFALFGVLVFLDALNQNGTALITFSPDGTPSYSTYIETIVNQMRFVAVGCCVVLIVFSERARRFYKIGGVI